MEENLRAINLATVLTSLPLCFLQGVTPTPIPAPSHADRAPLLAEDWLQAGTNFPDSHACHPVQNPAGSCHALS